MNKSKEEKVDNILGVVVAVVVLTALTALGYSYAITSRGDKAFHDLVVFIVLFLVLFGFAILAGWQINGKDPFKILNKKIGNKNPFFKMIVGRDNKTIKNIVGGAFHLLPLYATLFLIRMDLFVGFKAALIILALFSYMLVEINYIFSRTLGMVKYFNIKSKLGITALIVIIPLVIFVSIGYFVYGLLHFYMVRFPVN
jgi:hypothetical protein